MRTEPGVERAGRSDSTRPLVTADFDYELPEELIAQRPSQRRDASRLLVLDRNTGDLQDRRFTDLPAYLAPGDALVLNDTRVFPARLVGRKPTGAPAEVLLLEPESTDPSGRNWKAIVRPGGKLKPGRTVIVSEELQVRITDSTGDGGRLVRLESELEPTEVIERYGRVPLPPYVQREDDAEDRERYQTVYAAATGSVAAPTAGLHFTTDLLDRLEVDEIDVARVTLHVGLGTFRPVEVEDPTRHVLHAERWEMRRACAESLSRTRLSGGRIWAVGTTSARASSRRSGSR